MSRYDLFRRRIAPIAFGVAIVLLARDACNKEERVHATMVFDVGAGRHVEGLAVELTSDGSLESRFTHGAFSGSVQQDIVLSAPDGVASIELDVGNAEPRRTTRHFHAEEGSTVTIQISDLADLAAK